ncbi:MAG: MBL fold metallo-hydrolase [Verrucomicrobiota bacterium]
MDLELVLLGTGTSVGVPVLGCQCPTCLSSDPRDRRTRSAAWVRTPECSFVIDTGPDLKEQCLREGVGEVNAALYTHSHTDHTVGFDDLRPFCFRRETRFPVYGSGRTLRALERMFPWAFDAEMRPGYVRVTSHVVEDAFTLGKTRITPIPMEHGSEQAYGYRFDREGCAPLAYLTDCKRVLPKGLERLAGVELAVVDALREKPHPTHMNFDEAADLVRLLKVRRAWFTHLTHDLTHDEVSARVPEQVEPAYDGLRIQP